MYDVVGAPRKAHRISPFVPCVGVTERLFYLEKTQ